ncbi:hypothetical protein BDZ89DRAFT_1039343 [Hymenopellis radicata]|nr:hypothetical protein BDZ89DRAFT_1039343 [Hymenopellis radicata]
MGIPGLYDKGPSLALERFNVQHNWYFCERRPPPLAYNCHEYNTILSTYSERPGSCGRDYHWLLLSVNTPPLDAEAAILLQIVQKSSADIESLQLLIIKAQETLSALMGLQETASRRIADAKRILHPMRSLPQDILTEIFLCCTPSVNHHEVDWSWHGTNFDSLCPLNHPWNISHVSHRWREISLSLPRLWSVIYLDFTRYTSFSPRQCFFVGSLLFERSAKLDLCVNIASGEEYIGDHPLMPLLKESTTRWRILNPSENAVQAMVKPVDS